jgi:hypothetical protein
MRNYLHDERAVGLVRGDGFLGVVRAKDRLPQRPRLGNRARFCHARDPRAGALSLRC